MLSIPGHQRDPELLRKRDVDRVSATQAEVRGHPPGRGSSRQVERHETEQGIAEKGRHDPTAQRLLPGAPGYGTANLRQEEGGRNERIALSGVPLEPMPADGALRIGLDVPGNPHAGADDSHNSRRPSLTASTAPGPGCQAAAISAASASSSAHIAAICSGLGIGEASGTKRATA